MTTPVPPSVRVGRAWRQWLRIGATPWLVRQLQFGLQLPWTAPIPYRPTREYPLQPQALRFARAEVHRWISLGFIRRATPAEEIHGRKSGTIFSAFVTVSAAKYRLVIDYQRANGCLQPRTFRMDRLSDLAPTLRPGDSLLKADVKDAYYHLRLRPADQLRLLFIVDGCIYVPLCLNCGLSVAPWFFTKTMRPVVAFLCSLGHRVYSFIDDIFGAAKPSASESPASPRDTRHLGRMMHALFQSLGLSLHPTKQDFSGAQSLEILGITVDSSRQMFLLPPSRVSKVTHAAGRLLAYASRHRRHVRVRELRSFTGLANAASPALLDALLRVRELFNRISSIPPSPPTLTCPSWRLLEEHRRPRERRTSDPVLSHAAMRDLK